MKMKTVLRSTMVGVACLSLSACFGSSTSTNTAGGSGSSSGGSSSGSSFDAKYDSYKGMIVTQTKMTGTVEYLGKTKLDTFDASGSSTPNGSLTGDVAVSANFDTQALSGTVKNIKGTVAGQDVAFTGTLDTANMPGTSTAASTSIAVAGIPQTAGKFTSTLSANMRGKLTETTSNKSGNVNYSFLASVVGDNGLAAHGVAGANILDPVERQQLGFNLGAAAGKVYLEKQ